MKDLVARTLARDAALVQTAVDAVRRDEPDAVHQLRVACRRTRADLGALHELLDDPRVPILRRELRWLGGTFGSVRDLEVLRGRLVATATQPPTLDPGPLDELLATAQQRATEDALVALNSARCAELLVMLSGSMAPTAKPQRKPRLVGHARSRLRKALRRLEPDSPDRDWHRARILAKHCRYTAEALERPAVARWARHLQELLGEHQDAVMTASRVLALAPQHLELAELCGRLAERELERAREVRREVLAER